MHEAAGFDASIMNRGCGTGKVLIICLIHQAVLLINCLQQHVGKTAGRQDGNHAKTTFWQ